MSKSRESKYAAKLRELGFEHISQESLAYMEHRIDRRLKQLVGSVSRHERRAAEAKIRKVTKTPSFVMAPDGTIAIDETGQQWEIKKPIDLAELGFRNDTPTAIINHLALPPLDPEKTH